MSAEEAARQLDRYRYAYLGVRRSEGKLHILHVDHGPLCRPQATDYWVPGDLKADAAHVLLNDGLWITLVAAHTLCATCKKRFENGFGVLQVTAPPS